MSCKCIYCKEQKSHTDFNSEHVIPQAFGLYGEKTLTLVNKVCKFCNQKFGNTIDLDLARETLEGVHRFISGVPQAKGFDTKKHAKNQKRLAKTGFLSGQVLEPIAHPSGDGLAYNLQNQSDVAFKRKEDGQYDFYLLKDIPNKEVLRKKYFLCEIKIVNNSHKQKIAKYLSQLLKMPYTLEDVNEEGIILTEYKYDINVISRGIAKIGFNYFAHHNDTDVLLQPCFDPIRDFIATGTGQWSDFLSIEKEPIVPDQNGRAADVHLITIFKAGDEIHASVSLHNLSHYKIFLTHQYKGVPIKAEYGNWFDPHAKKIGVLEKSSLVKKPVSLIVPVKSILWLPS